MNGKDLNKIIFSIATLFFIVAIFYYLAMHPMGNAKNREIPPKTFVNTKPAKYVLEINSGKARDLNIVKGDRLSL